MQQLTQEQKEATRKMYKLWSEYENVDNNIQLIEVYANVPKETACSLMVIKVGGREIGITGIQKYIALQNILAGLKAYKNSVESDIRKHLETLNKKD